MIPNPKALNLEALKGSTSKVVLGFKCDPELKFALANEASEQGISLSAHVENLLMNFQEEKLLLTEAKKQMTIKLKEQAERIAFYENDFIKELLAKNQNREVEYVNTKNENVKVKIADIKDIFTIIINSFKIKSND